MQWKVTKVKSDEALGTKLIRAREARGLTRTQVGKQHFLPLSFLEAIEESKYEKLPEKVYAEGMFKKYLDILSLPQEEYISLWREEYIYWKNLTHEKGNKKREHPQTRSIFNAELTPTFWHKGFLLLAGFIFLIYIGVKVDAAIAETYLEVFSPPDQFTTHERTVEVIGLTEPEVVLTINHERVTVREDGYFRKVVTLYKGLNTLEFEATKKYRPTQQLERHIVVGE